MLSHSDFFIHVLASIGTVKKIRQEHLFLVLQSDISGRTS